MKASTSGSFKDRGDAGRTKALEEGSKGVILSTGNTSASVELYAARAKLPHVVLPDGRSPSANSCKVCTDIVITQMRISVRLNTGQIRPFGRKITLVNP